jgi:hypothetical protein
MKKAFILLLIAVVQFALSCKKTEYGFIDYNNVILVFQTGDWIVLQSRQMPVNTCTIEDFDLMKHYCLYDSTYQVYKILSFYKWKRIQYIAALEFDTTLKVADPSFCNIDTAYLLTHCKTVTAGIRLKDRSTIIYKIFPCNRDSIDDDYFLQYKVKVKKIN